MLAFPAMNGWAWLLVGASLVACRPAQVPSTTSGMRIVAVDADPAKRPGHLLLRWEGPYDGEHALYALIDEKGYRGLVQSGDRSTTDCDHCPGPLVDGQLDSGPGPSEYGAIAVGPVDGPMPRANMKRVKPHALDQTWRAVTKVDLDGDGRWDLEEVRRCGHTVRSGCSDEVCDMTCTAVTPPGHDPDPKLMNCVSFVPDLEDCAPAGD